MGNRVKYDINFLKEPFIAQQFSFIVRNKNEVLQLTCAAKNQEKVWMNTSEEVLVRKKQQIIYYILSLRSFRNDQRRKTWTKQAQDDKKKQLTPGTQKENGFQQGKGTLIRKYIDNLVKKTKTAASSLNIKNFWRNKGRIDRAGSR